MDQIETNDATVEEVLEEVVTEETPVAEEPKPVDTQKEETQGIRFKAIREARERAERERDELKLRLENIEAAKVRPQEIKEEDFTVAPDDFVEGKHLSKYDRDIKRLQKELENYKQQTAAATVETRLRSEFNDFDSVVSKENIEVLRTAYPHIAAALNSSSDLYNKAASAYTMIKKLGIHDAETFNAEREKVQANTAKPRPISSLNAKSNEDSPLSNANAFAGGMTKEMKAQLYREMLENKKRR